MESLLITLEWMLVAACIGSGMMAGLFSAFSSFIMKALSSLSSSNGIKAMQAINRFIVRPSFLLVFFGTGILCAASLLLGWNVLGASLWTTVAATVSYIVGCLFATILFNVPLNNQLDAVDPESVEGQVLWAHYLSRWTSWNHVRSIATLSSTFLLVLSLVNLE